MPAAASERKTHALALFAGIPGEYDRAGAVLGLGQDARWRRALVEEVAAEPGDRVVDVATGTGLVAAELVARYGCEVVGVDQSPDMLAVAESRRAGDDRLAARFTTVRAEAERLPFADAEFDALTFTYLLRYVDDPAATLAELARVVKPGGTIAMLEFGRPDAGLLRAGWGLYTRAALPLLGRLFSDEWADVGRFLGPSIADFYERFPLDRLTGIWAEKGISAVRVRRMTFGAGVVMAGVRDGDRA
jgi:demethylmenaquinone methyltransferase / 2-methoxy-6-polyprenyl-1,4-benzoquinol methylase